MLRLSMGKYILGREKFRNKLIFFNSVQNKFQWFFDLKQNWHKEEVKIWTKLNFFERNEKAK